MKKILILLIVATCLVGRVFALTYDQANYKQHMRQSLTASRNDPIYNFIGEMESVAAGGERGTGSFIYVDSNVSSAGAGTSWSAALATLQEGIDACADNAGDYIYVAQGHEEDLATAAVLLFNCPGVTVIGFGSGDEMPEFSLTAQASTVSVTAPDVTIYNLRFLGEWAGGSTLGIDVQATGDGFRMFGCELRSNSNNEELLIALNVTAAANNLVIAGNSFVFETGGTESSAIVFEGASNKSVVYGNRFDGDWSGYPIDASGATSVQMLVEGNIIHNMDTTAGLTMAFATASTGDLIGNKCYGNHATGFTPVGDAMFISPDNVFMGTENVETRNYETMFGPFTGATGGAAGTNIFSDIVLLDALLDEIIVDTDTTIPAKIDVTDSLVAGIAASIAAIDQRFGYAGTCEVNAGGTTFATCASLAGFGDDYFNTGWSLIVILNFDSAGATPEGDIIDIIDYTSDTGIFELNVAAGAAITTGDGILILRREELNLDDPAMLGSSGEVLYVDSGTAGDGSGLTMENAYATLTLALDGATESTDAIIVASAHAETISAAYAIDDIGLLIKGLGEGFLRPTFTFDTSTANANLDVSVANVTFDNLIFYADLADLASCFDVAGGGDGLTIKNSLFYSAATNKEFLKCIDLTTGADDCRVENCTFLQVDTDADAGIDVSAGAVDNLQVVDCVFMGDYDNSCVYSNQTITNAVIIGNVFRQDTAGAEAFGVGDAATGIVANNRLYANDYATMFDFGAMFSIDNWGTDAVDQQAIRIPLSAETTDVTGVADGSDLERLEYLQQLTNDAITFFGVGTGDIFYVDSSASGTTGIDWANAVNDLQEATGLLTASDGDYVFIAPGHAETMGGAGAIDLDIAGVTYIGLGTGFDMPTFTYDTDVDTMLIATAGDGTRIVNFKFVSAVTAVANALTVEAGCTDFIIEDCVFENTATGTDEFIDAIIIAGTASDRGIIRGCRFLGDPGANAGPQSSINFVDCDYLQIYDCEFSGDIFVAHIENAGAASNYITIRDNRIMCGFIGDASANLDTKPGITLFASTTGWIEDNFIVTNVATPDLAIVAADCYLKGNTYNELQGAAFAASSIGLVPGQTYVVQMSMATADDDNLFLVAGGPILITSLTGYITGDIGAAAFDISIIMDHATQDFEFTSTLDVQAGVNGGLIVFSAAAPAAPVLLGIGADAGAGNPMVPWHSPVGMIELLDAGGGTTGTLTWSMTFIPLTNGVTVTPQ